MGNVVKDWALALFVVVALLAVWKVVAPGPPSSGAAPEFTLPDVEGGEISLADYDGKAVIINFWATWCGPCVGELPELAAFARAHPEVPMIGISIDDPGATGQVRAFSRKRELPYTILHDNQHIAADLYGVSVIPTTFVLDSEHSILDVIVGPTSADALAAEF